MQLQCIYVWIGKNKHVIPRILTSFYALPACTANAVSGSFNFDDNGWQEKTHKPNRTPKGPDEEEETCTISPTSQPLLEGRLPSCEELIEELNAKVSNSPASSGLSEPPELPVSSGQQDHVPELPSRADKLFSAVMDNFIWFLATENERARQREEQHQEQAQQNEEQHQEEMREFLLSLFKESSRREAKTFTEFHTQQKEFTKTITAAIATSIKEAKVLHQSSNQAFIDVIAGWFPLPATPSDEPSSITTTMSATDEDPKTTPAGPSYSHKDKGKRKESSDPPKRSLSTPGEPPSPSNSPSRKLAPSPSPHGGQPLPRHPPYRGGRGGGGGHGRGGPPRCNSSDDNNERDNTRGPPQGDLPSDDNPSDNDLGDEEDPKSPNEDEQESCKDSPKPRRPMQTPSSGARQASEERDGYDFSQLRSGWEDRTSRARTPGDVTTNKRHSLFHHRIVHGITSAIQFLNDREPLASINNGLKMVASSTPTPAYKGEDDLEMFMKWLQDYVNYLEIHQLVGATNDYHRILATSQVLKGKASTWYSNAVKKKPRIRHQGSPKFLDVILGLANMFIMPATAAKAQQSFDRITYSRKEGIRAFAQELKMLSSHILMPIDEYTLQKQILEAIPVSIRNMLIDYRGLSPSMSSVMEWVDAIEHRKWELLEQEAFDNMNSNPRCCGDKSLSKTLLFRLKGQYAEHQWKKYPMLIFRNSYPLR
jgi:hypothetical protein